MSLAVPVLAGRQGSCDANARFALVTPRDTGHRLTGVRTPQQSLSVSHDSAARVSAIGPDALVWHPSGEFAAVTQNAQLREGYLYDGIGRLVGIVGPGQQSVSRVHAYIDDDPVASLDRSGGVLWEASWGPSGLIEVREPAAGAVTLPIADANGTDSTVALRPGTANLAGLDARRDRGR